MFILFVMSFIIDEANINEDGSYEMDKNGDIINFMCADGDIGNATGNVS